MDFAIIFMWIVFSFIVGAIGAGRNIGFLGSFVLSIFLSPLIGLIITLVSESKTSYNHRMQMIRKQNETNQAIKNMQSAPVKTASLTDELEKLSKLKEQNLISEEDFNKAKAKLLD